MIHRYARSEMELLFTDKNRFDKWLDVELAAATAFEELGVIPHDDLKKLIENATYDIERIYEIETITHHDVVAFTRAVSEQLGPEKRWIHYGLTSTDVVDTAYAVVYKEANDLIELGINELRETLKKQALRFSKTPCIGRTHGVHADITCFGLKFALWYDEMNRQLDRFIEARKQIEVGKISGAVGNFANTEPYVQDRVCELLNIGSANISTQVLQRDRHAYYLSVIALIGSSLEKMAVEIRHLQRTEVNEVQEYFSSGQKGSSAMPHKRNPIGSENIVGCSRVLRGYMMTSFEDIALWHERDISHSSAERIIFPDAILLIDYMLHRFNTILANLIVHEDHMLENINMTHGVIFAQRVMTTLIELGGISREAAYDLVQPIAMRAYETKQSFKSLLDENDEINQLLTEKQLVSCFEMDFYMKEVETIYRRVGLIDGTM